MVKEYDHEDAEYQFQDNESVAAEPGQDQTLNYDQDEKFQQMLKQAKMKRIISVLIVLVVFSLIGYRTITFFFGHKAKTVVAEKQQPIVIPQQPAVVSLPQTNVLPEKTTEDINQLKTQVEQLTTANDKLNENLSQQQDKNENQFSDLSQQLSEMSNNMGQLKVMATILSNRLYKMEQVKKDEAKQKAAALAQQQKNIRASKKYYVEAVIPGRAWLRGIDGSAITVSVGDTISGYGRINSIDSYSGVVVTSLGGSLKYGTSGN